MRMGLASEEFGRAFAGPLRAFATVETAMVEEELEEGQVVGTEVTAKGEVVAQPTVEVLDEGTGADGSLSYFADGLVDGVETFAELLAKFGLALPAAWVGGIQVLQTQQFAKRVDGDLESDGALGEVAVKRFDEAEQLVAMVVEEGAERVEAIRALRGARTQLGDDEIIQDAAFGAGGPAHGEDIRAEPLGQDGDIVGQGDGLLLLGPGVRQLGRQALVGAAVTPLMRGGFAFDSIASGHGLVGMIFQNGNDGDDGLHAVKDIAPARLFGVGQIAAGTQAGAEVGDECFGVEALLLEFEQTHAPGHAVTMGFLAEQKTIRRGGVDADEHWRLRLEDLIQQADVDGVERLLSGDAAGDGNGLVDDVVDRAEAHVAAETIVKVVDDAAVATAAIEQQGNDVHPQPFLGDGKLKEDLIIVVCRCERLFERLLGDIDLLVDKLAADLGMLGQRGDRECAADGLEGQRLPFLGLHVPSGTSVGDA